MLAEPIGNQVLQGRHRNRLALHDLHKPHPVRVALAVKQRPAHHLDADGKLGMIPSY